MREKNTDYRHIAETIFLQAPFIQDIGLVLKNVEAGFCESQLKVLPRHQQQNGFVHAGVQSTICDHTAGAAAATLLEENEIVLTVEFKINLLRPALGEQLFCRAHVLRPGKTLIVAEAELFAHNKNEPKLVAKSLTTLAFAQQEPV